MEEYLYLKSHDIPLYGCKLVVVLTNSKSKLNGIVKFGDRDIYAHALYANYKGKKAFMVIFNFHDFHENINHGVIAHEAFNATYYLAEEIGFCPDVAKNEPFAYLHEWIVDPT